jgi:hypothetical protein
MGIFHVIYLDRGITIWKKDARAISLSLVLMIFLLHTLGIHSPPTPPQAVTVKLARSNVSSLDPIVVRFLDTVNRI